MTLKKRRNFSTDLERNPKDLVKYLDLALEGANLGIWDWYLTDNSVKFDRRWAEMLGIDYSKIKMELATWESRVHPDDLDQAYRDIKAYMDGKTPFYENIHRMKHADGHWVYILDRGRFSDWDEAGKPTRFTGTHFDITHSERYKKKLSIFFDHSPFGYAFCDMDGNLLEINQRYADLTGYTHEELKELSYWDITPKKYEKDEARQLESLSSTGRYGPYRKEYIQKDGTIIPVELNGFIVEDYDGVTGIWSTVEDISEKKALEGQLIHSSKLASIGTLAAGVGHEINNPLAIAKLYIESIREKHNPPQALIEDLTQIESCIDRITKIVAGLRTFSKVDSGLQDKVEINSALNHTLSITKEIIKNQDVAFNVELSATEGLGVMAYEGRMEQVFINILTNAMDAVENTERPKISIVTSKKRDKIFIKIRDNGEGITEENMQKIFDPFFTTKETNKGTGLGLSIAYNIVKSHEGNLEVSSSVGGGTIFTITLPCVKDSARKKEDAHRPIKDTQSKKSFKQEKKEMSLIMVVEDEPQFLKVFTSAVTRAGIEVEGYQSSVEALAAFKKSPHRYDVIISDVQMVKMNGLELLDEVRALKNEAWPKFVLMSGGVSVDLQSLMEEKKCTLDGYLYKPFSTKDITNLLEKLLKK